MRDRRIALAIQAGATLLLMLALGLSPVRVAIAAALLLPIWLLTGRPQEPLELESALSRTRHDLQQKSQALTREREELTTLMGAISDGILAVDHEGRPLFFNSRFALLFYPRELQEQEARLPEIFRAPDVLNAFSEVLRSGAVREIDLPLLTKNEPLPRFFSISIAALRRDDGGIYGAVGVFHDVTDLKRAETIRIEFVGNVSHELRTPLTAIKGYADTLREDVSNGEFGSATKFLEVIGRNVERLMHLIDDLLDLSSLESMEAGQLTKASLSTREITERVLAALETRRAAKNHRIETSFTAQAILADPVRLEQVLVNLLENAIKYVPSGGRIGVHWEPETTGVRLRIEDNGPGIAPEHLPRLFERFYRVDKARSRELGGTGLGLAIVKHIMQRHGGSISVRSQISGGTEFTCRFPQA